MIGRSFCDTLEKKETVIQSYNDTINKEKSSVQLKHAVINVLCSVKNYGNKNQIYTLILFEELNYCQVVTTDCNVIRLKIMSLSQ